MTAKTTKFPRMLVDSATNNKDPDPDTDEPVYFFEMDGFHFEGDDLRQVVQEMIDYAVKETK